MNYTDLLRAMMGQGQSQGRPQGQAQAQPLPFMAPNPDQFAAYQDVMRMSGMLAPRGIGWQQWRPSENVEDRRYAGAVQDLASRMSDPRGLEMLSGMHLAERIGLDVPRPEAPRRGWFWR